MAEYGKFIQAIDGFDTYAKNVVKNCEAFLEFAIKTGSEIGSAASEFSTKALLNGKSKSKMEAIGLVILSNYGEKIGKKIGSAVGNFKKDWDYENAKEAILKDGLAYKQRALHLIPESLEIFNRYSKVYELSLKEALSKISISTTDDEYVRELEILSIRNEVRNLYQIEYRRDLGNQIISYFEQFEQKLSDLEVFAQWFDSKIMCTKRDTYLRCNYIIHTKLLEATKDEKVKERINEDFEILKGIIPIIDISGKDSQKLLDEISNKLEAELNNKMYNRFSYPEFFYKESGFNRLYLCFRNHFNTYVMPKFPVYKGELRSKLIKKSITISLIIFALLFFIGVVKNHGVINSLLVSTLPIISILVLIYLIKIRKFKKELISSPLEKAFSENPELLKSSIRSLGDEFADDEKNRNSNAIYSQVENLAKTLEHNLSELPSKKQNKLSEDDMLAAIMQTGSIDSVSQIKTENNNQENIILNTQTESIKNDKSEIQTFSSLKKILDETKNSEWIEWIESFQNFESAESVYFEVNHYPGETDCFLFIIIKDKVGKEISSHKWKLAFELNYNQLNKKSILLKD